MSDDFNLVSDKWIKLVPNEEVSLLEFFDREEAPQLGGTPIQKLVVFRLLLAILQRACFSEDEDDGDDEELSIQQMKQAAIKYLTEKRGCFGLRDPERPFLQHPGITKANDDKSMPIAALLPGVCTGNATVLFDSNLISENISDADMVYVLLQTVTFGMGGKKPDKSLVFSSGYTKKSAPPSPSLGRGWLHSFAVGADLYQTLRLNLVTPEMLDEERSLQFLKKGIGVPPWEIMPVTEIGPDAQTYASTVIGWLVPISRFCRIFGNALYMTSGVEYPKIDTGICDLSVATKDVGSGTKQTITAVRAQKTVAPWRQLDAILAFFKGGTARGCRALNLAFHYQRKSVRGIWCVGMQVSEQSGEQYMSGTDDFVESLFVISPDWLGQTFLDTYEKEMLKVDQIRKALYVCVCNYYKDMGSKELGAGFAARAQAEFWTLCADAGEKMIGVCGTPQAFDNSRQFHAAARAAYDRVCPKTGTRQLVVYEKNRPIFLTKKEGNK